MNHIKVCGESINDLQKIERVLRYLTAHFDYIVVSMEESKNLVEMKLEELQALLKAHEMRLKQGNLERDKVTEQALQAIFIKKYGKEKAKQRKNLANDEKSSKNSKNHSTSTKKNMGNRKKEVRAKDIDEAQYAYVGDNDYDDVLLMENIKSSNNKTSMWNLDSECSNHMTGNKTCFTKLDDLVKKVIKFADGRHVTSYAKGNINVVRKDVRKANIPYVLYVPSMTSKLISIGQLLAKGYNIKL
ncbi:uncharacterized protein LOC131619543 [Vicia villosa]|uniref:uncharacterized protein LOC131619543 n=1 Tax=Vicia villosa TaxID=3911 RepID=UPI00273AE21D|nr:uncharacterized protein LOC131619543 [Vicia villosa]